MVVNDLDYVPADPEIDEKQRQSDLDYNSDSSGATSNDRLILAKAIANVTGGFFILPQAAGALEYFLLNIGQLYKIPAEIILMSKNARKNLRKNLNYVLKTSEAMVMDGRRTVISTTSALRKWSLGLEEEQFRATDLSDHGHEDSYNNAWDRVWWFTLGNSHAAMVWEASRTGTKYSIKLNYYINDFYDWERNSKKPGGLVNNGEMFRLHEVGLAKQYRIEGSYKGLKIQWAKCQRFYIPGEADTSGKPYISDYSIIKG